MPGYDIHIIGGGLAGSEAAWQLAQAGHKVRLSEMRGSGEMLRDRNFLGHILPLGFAFALNFGMLAGVPFILQESLGFSPKEFGLIVLLSELNYRVIEMPMRNRGAALVKRLGTSRTAIPSSGATSC